MDQLRDVGLKLFPGATNIRYIISSTVDVKTEAYITIAYVICLQRVVIYIKDGVLEEGRTNSR